ncbi:hypothetical protein [Vibrio sp. TRT 2004]|uniref:hypothetical protein n=1 Tax=Vibrio sp. TRT 2004 TaxID=3418506 RepID=UPI003CEEC6CB
MFLKASARDIDDNYLEKRREADYTDRIDRWYESSLKNLTDIAGNAKSQVVIWSDWYG